MTRTRLEAFSDAVIAIIMTVMVLELRPPREATLDALRPVLPLFLTYLLSFVILGIYWNNHHHMFHTVDRVNGAILWANLHLLFWLSLVPFTTAWMGAWPRAVIPTAVYGIVFLASAVAYTLLQHAIIRDQGEHSKLRAALGRDVKGKVSAVLYVSAIPLALVHPFVSDAIFVAVAMMWLIPDRRIEKRMH